MTGAISALSTIFQPFHSPEAIQEVLDLLACDGRVARFCADLLEEAKTVSRLWRHGSKVVVQPLFNDLPHDHLLIVVTHALR